LDTTGTSLCIKIGFPLPEGAYPWKLLDGTSTSDFPKVA
jgi:hypothetical protein